MTGWRIGWAAGPREPDPRARHAPVAVGRQRLLDQPGGRGRGAQRRPGLRRRERRDLPRAARRDGGRHQRDPRPVLPRARRRLLPLRQLRRPDRRDDAGRQPARHRRRRRHVPARKRRRRRRGRRRLRPLALFPPVDRDLASTRSTKASPASPARSPTSRTPDTGGEPMTAIENESVSPAGGPRHPRSA